MTADLKTNFLGIPIDGDIERSDHMTQRPLEEFEPIVAVLLADPLVHSFGWSHDTPYFNDGDPCVFSAFSFWLKTTEDVAGGATVTDLVSNDDEDDEDEDDEDEDEDDDAFAIDRDHPTLGGLKGWGDKAVYVGDHETTWTRANAVSKAISDGEFNSVLLQLFGDHCKVTVRREGISVNAWDHG